MFTGIVEEIGRMRNISRRGQAMVLTFEANRILEDVHLGDSIAVNGVCLTVTGSDSSTFTVDVMPETFRRTNLGDMHNGDRVNLERAMSAQGRFGGHIVQGHVDSTGTIRLRKQEENAVVFTIEPENPSILKYVIPRGSITLDGISLTVVQVTETMLSVSIIPHTLSQTILGDKMPGATVNMECDLLGKYVERLLNFSETKEERVSGMSKGSKLTEHFLAENGFL